MNTENNECLPAIEYESTAVHSYLNILQAVINRMAANSASCKSWCITLVTGIIVILLNKDKSNLVYIALSPALLFLLLDCYYLATEKSFRDKYNNFINKLHQGNAVKTDLFITAPEKKANSCMIICAFRSISIWPFYVAIIAMIIVIRNVL